MASLHEYQKRIVEEFRKRKSVTIEVIPQLTAKNQTVTNRKDCLNKMFDSSKN